MNIEFYFKESGGVIDDPDARLFVWGGEVWQDNFETCESQSARVDFDTFVRERKDVGWRVPELIQSRIDLEAARWFSAAKDREIERYRKVLEIIHGAGLIKTFAAELAGQALFPASGAGSEGV